MDKSMPQAPAPQDAMAHLPFCTEHVGITESPADSWCQHRVLHDVDVDVTVEQPPGRQAPVIDLYAAPVILTPARARELAAALMLAAEVAESV